MSIDGEFIMEFRAATWYRLLGNIERVKENDNDSLLNKILNLKDISPFQETLGGMIMQINYSSAVACFPTNNLNELSDMVIYTAHHYHLHPQLATKISTICCIENLEDSNILSLDTRKHYKRLEEIAYLNYKFEQLSKIIENEDVKVNSELFQKEGTIFHPKSQYLRVTVKIL